LCKNYLFDQFDPHFSVRLSRLLNEDATSLVQTFVKGKAGQGGS
jgi:hypothetical protein